MTKHSGLVCVAMVSVLAAYVPAQRPVQRTEAEPALSIESLDKLRDWARASRKTGRIGRQLASLLDIEDAAVPAKQLSAARPDGKYYMCFALPWENDQIVFAVIGKTRSLVYRSDSAPSLRRAGVADKDGVRRLERDAAQDGFQHVLRVWEEIAQRGSAPPGIRDAADPRAFLSLPCG